MSKPPFDPNKSFVAVEPVVAGEKPKFDPNKDFVASKENVVVAKPGLNPYKRTPQEEKMIAIGKVVEDLSFSEGYNEDEKQHLINEAQRPELTYDQWNDDKLIMGGNHPLQGGFQTYYMGDDGRPKVVPLGQKPPKGKDISSIWGSQEAADDDNVFTTVAKNVASALPGIIENIASIPAVGYGLATGNDAEWYTDLKNRMAALSPATSSASQESFLKTENINSLADIANMDNWSFTPDNIAGAIGSVAKSAIEFMAGGAAAKGVGIGAKAIDGASKLPYIVGGMTVNIGDALEAADEAGVDGRAKFAMATIYATAASLVETSLGLEASLIKNPIAQAQKNALTKSLIKEFVKDTEGRITKESADELFKITTGATASLLGSLAKDAVVTGLEEGAEEVAQNAIQKASQQIYDNMYAENKKVGEGRYGTEVGSPEALADYINDFIAGSIGGGVGAAGVGKYRRAKADAQSENAYEYIKKGPAGVTALKAQLAGGLKSGKITKEEYDLGVFKVDTYNKYYEQTKDLGLDDNSNRRVFDLTWSNENLKQQQQELSQNPESKIKGTISHRRLLDTKALLEANSKEMSKLMAQNIADQQTAIAVESEQKLTETKAAANKPTGKPLEAKPETIQNSLINQIKGAETEKDVDALFKEADTKGVTSPDLIDAVGKRREEIRKFEALPTETKEFIEFTGKEHPLKNWNNLADISNSVKSDTIVKHLINKGANVLKGGTLELGQFADKIVNGKKLPLYYDVDFGGKRIKIASSDYTKFIKEKNLVGKKVDVQLVMPTDENLNELVDEGVVDSHDVVERTSKDGIKEKFFVFKEDESRKQRYPFVLVVRLQTKSGNPGVKIGNFQVNDYSVVSKKREGREGLYRPKKENAKKPGDVETATPGQVVGDADFDFETAVPDFEAQLAATPITEDEDEDVTTFRDEPAPRSSTALDELNKRKQQEQAKLDAQKAASVKSTPKPQEKPAPVSNKSEVTYVKPGPNSPEKEAYINEQVQSQIDDGDFEAGSEGEDLARLLWGNKWDIVNRKKDKKNEGVRGKKSQSNKNAGEAVSGQKIKKVRIGNKLKKEDRKIKDKKRLSALALEVFNPYDIVRQYFVGEGKIHPLAISEAVKKSRAEFQSRIGLINSKAPTVDTLANLLWESQDDLDSFTTQDFKNAILDVIRDYVSAKDMADDLLDTYSEKESVDGEDPMAKYYDVNAEPEFVDEALDYWETLTDEEKEFLAKESEGNKPPDDVNQKQKVKTLAAIEIEKEIVKAEAELKAAKTAFDKKRKELDDAIVADNRDLFGERKSSSGQGMFDERVDVSARDKVLEPFKVRLEKATKALISLNDKLKAEEGKQDLTLFQRGSSLTTESKADRDKKIELLKKAIPALTVVEDDTIGDDVAGQLDADGKTVRLNPRYNFLDTPIHEFAHALIDMMGGTNNALIKKGIDQLRGTDLWAKKEKMYPELSEDMLAKEVLAEAIGKEGAILFSDKIKQSKFQSWLSGFFYKLKSLLGIDKNVAKKLAVQLLSGKRIELDTVATGEAQNQKLKEEKVIKDAKPLSYGKWIKEQNFDELSIKEDVSNIKEDIAGATTEAEKEELSKKLDILEESLKNKKLEHEQYVADFNAVVEFVKSKGDVSELSLDELNEVRSQMIKYDDLVRTKLYKDLVYNIGVKVNEIQSEQLKSADPDYDPEQEQKGDLTKTDIWAQGLSTISAKFPAIQYFYKQYRKAFGDMNREFSNIQSRGQELAKAVIKEYKKKAGIADNAKGFILGAGDEIFAFMAKDGKLVEKGSTEYNKLSAAQKQLLDFVTEQKRSLDPYMEGEGSVLLKSGAGFIESFKKSGIFKAYANYITQNHNLRGVTVSFKNPETGKVSDMLFSDVEAELQKFGKKGPGSNIQAMALLTKYNLQARKGLETKRGSKGKYFLKPDGTLVSMFGGEFKGDFTTNYYETFMKYAQDAVFSKNMSPLMPMLTGVEMFYKSMGSDKENVSKFLEVVKKGKFLGETIESGLGEKGDIALRVLRKWTSWRFIAFNIPANIWNVAVGEYNQFRADGFKSYAKGKQRFFGSMLKGRKNAKAYNILKKYHPELMTDINRVNPENHVGKFFDMMAFGGQKLGEGIIRGAAIIGKLSTEHYNWLDSKGDVKGTPDQVEEREAILKAEIAKYISEVEKVQGRYSDVEKRNFSYFELGQFFGQFKVWMPEWISDRFARTYIDADGIKRKGSFNTLWTYGMRDFLRDATKKDFYTSNDPKQVAARKQLRGMIITSVLLLSYLSSSDDDDDKDMANTLDKALRNISSIYRMDNNTFLISQPAAAMSVVVDLSKTLNSAIQGQVIKSGKNKGDIKALDLAYNLIPANKLLSTPAELLTDDE